MRMASSLVRESAICPCHCATRIEFVFAFTPAPRSNGWLIENDIEASQSSSVPPNEAPLALRVSGEETTISPPVASGTVNPASNESELAGAPVAKSANKLLSLRR